jgi:hypothetical protein
MNHKTIFCNYWFQIITYCFYKTIYSQCNTLALLNIFFGQDLQDIQDLNYRNFSC